MYACSFNVKTTETAQHNPHSKCYLFSCPLMLLLYFAMTLGNTFEININ